MPDKLMLTGANGMIGSALCEAFDRANIDVLKVVRSATAADQVGIGGIAANTDWRGLLKGVNTVIHTAAIVHKMGPTSAQDEVQLQEVNTTGTLNLARQALEAGVTRFVFISTVKVLGESTIPGQAFSETSEMAPTDVYSRSKADAEQGLLQMAKKSRMEIVILRLPLVYGPGVKGNLSRLFSWVNRGFPLPLAAVTNRRTLLSLGNLVSFVLTCVSHPNAKNEVFLVADDEDVSTTELLEKIGIALGKPARLFFLPRALLFNLARLSGKESVIERLYGSLQIDNSKAKNLLGWEPAVTVLEELRRTAEAYRSTNLR